jgi:hypothetical protein
MLSGRKANEEIHFCNLGKSGDTQGIFDHACATAAKNESETALPAENKDKRGGRTMS